MVRDRMKAPLLLTPGPLSTAKEVRAALARDHGSRDPAFVALVARIRQRLSQLSPDPDTFTAVLLPGSGTAAVEAMISSLVPPTGRLLVLDHGVYGARAAEMARRIGRLGHTLVAEEGAEPDLAALDALLAARPELTHVFAVHNETTTGQLLPLPAISQIVARHGRRLLVDAMSSFGAIGLDGIEAEAIASSANKCLEGVPGVAFVLVRRDAVAAAEGNAVSVSLDLHAQWARFAQDGQFRFTPPTHVLAAFHVALDLHAAEGGVAGRGARYRENMRRLLEGMTSLGFSPLLPPERQGPVIATFHLPSVETWSFNTFYEYLLGRGFAIYPGSLARTPSFRVGCIGQVFPADIDRFVSTVGKWRSGGKA